VFTVRLVIFLSSRINMPKLVRLYISSVIQGFGLALAFVALLLTLDVGGLRHLVLATEDGWLGGLLLLVFNGIVFSGVQFGVAVMRAADSDDDDGPQGGLREPVLIPVRVERRR
jgi:hypothetical protein